MEIQYTEAQIIEEIDNLGLSVDFGNLIDGPFIPDGRVRIHQKNNPYQLLVEASSLEEAFSQILNRI